MTKPFKFTKAQERWLQALESGEYKQARGSLRKGNAFCCLGVACDVSGMGKWKACDVSIRHTFHTGTESVLSNLPLNVRIQLNLRSEVGKYSDEQSLVQLNDSDHMALEEIAAFIRANPERVFYRGAA